MNNLSTRVYVKLIMIQMILLIDVYVIIRLFDIMEMYWIIFICGTVISGIIVSIVNDVKGELVISIKGEDENDKA